MTDSMLSGLRPLLEQVDPEHVTNGQLLMLLYSIRAQQIHSNIQIEELKEQIKASDIKQRDMLRTWETSKNVLAFVKMLATLGIPITMLIAGIRLAMSKFGL